MLKMYSSIYSLLMVRYATVHDLSKYEHQYGEKKRSMSPLRHLAAKAFTWERDKEVFIEETVDHS